MTCRWQRARWVNGLLAVLVFAALWAEPCLATELKQETMQAFDRYVASREGEMDRDVSPGGAFLWVDGLPEADREKARAQLKSGDVIVRSVGGPTTVDGISVPGGLIQDWVAVSLVPGARIAQVLELLQNYDHHRDYFRPLVERSELRARTGDDFQVYFRLKQVHIMTVVLDTDYDIHYFALDERHAYSRSHTTRIAEVENADQPQEHTNPPGEDHGFLWRLDTYWRFYQADHGVYVQLEAISLTRNVPFGLGWIVKPLMRSVPGEMLRFTLESTRNAVKEKMTAVR